MDVSVGRAPSRAQAVGHCASDQELECPGCVNRGEPRRERAGPWHEGHESPGGPFELRVADNGYCRPRNRRHGVSTFPDTMSVSWVPVFWRSPDTSPAPRVSAGSVIRCSVHLDRPETFVFGAEIVSPEEVCGCAAIHSRTRAGVISFFGLRPLTTAPTLKGWDSIAATKAPPCQPRPRRAIALCLTIHGTARCSGREHTGSSANQVQSRRLSSFIGQSGAEHSSNRGQSVRGFTALPPRPRPFLAGCH